MNRWLFLPAFALLAACGDEPQDAPAVGTLERDRIDLVAESDDPIVEIAVRVGQQVEAGELLLRLDPTRFDARVAQAEARRDEAAARSAEAARGPRAERVEEGRARLAGARSAARTAQRELERAEALAEVDFASRSRLDILRAGADAADAQKGQARAALDALLEGSTAEELDQSSSALAAAEAAVREALVYRERLELRAPVDGQIDALPFERGERARPGTPLVVMLADQAPYARVHVPQAVRVRIAPGSEATVEIEGLERTFRGRLREISNEASFTPYYALTRHDRGRLAYLAEVELVDPEARELPTGVPVEVHFTLGQDDAD
ncbi:MAG: HlyD family efflux transporter periplasmic adaptor subunit [Deltaproteobacteria bacterium]|nr:HlyD family efflux transporter periplasmic adaptor subunit [Deltaproteobacteria bacterium]